jgi:hypothetical protein
VWGRAGEREGGPGAVKSGSGGRHRPPAGGRGQARGLVGSNGVRGERDAAQR